jgi:pimeloyl-ACP methyl ester carboxylesterase
LAERARRRRDSFASFDEAFESYRGRGIFATWPPETLGDYLRGGLIAEKDGSMRLACAPQWEAEIFDDTRAGVAALAGTITCPILILHGTVASTSSTSELETIRDLQPQTRIVAFEGAGHFLPVEQPDAVRKEVLAWLAGA